MKRKVTREREEGMSMKKCHLPRKGVYFLLIVLLVFITSCRGGREVCGAMITDVDSLNVLMRDSVTETRRDSASVNAIATVEKRDSVTTIATSEEEEVVTERIEQTIDSMGVVRTVTERTIKRKFYGTNKENTMLWQKETNEHNSKNISKQETVRDSRYEYIDYHRSDSTKIETQKKSGGDKTWWQKILDFVYVAVQYALIVLWIGYVVYILVKTVINRD